MSLIHDALKKAEVEKNPQVGQPNNLPNPILSNGNKKSKRTWMLVCLLGVSLGLLIYLRLFSKPQTAPSPSPIQAVDIKGVTDNPLAMKKMAFQLYQEGKWEASLANWEKLTLLLPTEAEVYSNMGLVLKKLGKKEAAFQAYTKALALNQDYPEALNNLGVLYLENGQRKEAKTHFDKALALKSDYPDPHFHLGLIAEQTGNLKQAHQHYQQFLALSPQLDETVKQKIQQKMSRLPK